MKIFTFDGETKGLWGEAFCLAAAVLNDEGKIIDQFVGRCPISGEIDKWVQENVLPKLEDIPISYANYKELLMAFADFWQKWRKDIDVTVTHMGMIVEAKVIRDMHDYGFIGDWEAPYVTADCASFPMVGDSVDTYAKAHNIKVSGDSHNPLYDSLIAGKVYLDVIKK